MTLNYILFAWCNKCNIIGNTVASIAYKLYKRIHTSTDITTNIAEKYIYI